MIFVPAENKVTALKNPSVIPYEGYEFTSIPGFDSFEQEELSSLYAVGFSSNSSVFTNEIVPQGAERSLKLSVSQVGVKVISTSKHFPSGKEHYYDGLDNVGGKTFNGDISLEGYDGIMFWVGNYTDSLYVVLRNSPCGGPYGYDGDEEHRKLYDTYGEGAYFNSAPFYPDENGYVTFPFSAFFPGHVWWEQGTLKEEIENLNSIDIVFKDERLNMGDVVYLSDFKLYKEPPSERSLDELIVLLEQNNEDGEYTSEIADAKELLANGSEAEQKVKVKELTMLLKPVLLRELYINSYASMENRITAEQYAPTSVTGFYGGMFLRDTSIQTLMHTNQGDTHISRELLRYLLSACQELGKTLTYHVVSDLKPTAYGNNDGGNPGQYSPTIKLGGDAVASQVIKSTYTVVSVGVWISKKDGASGMLEAELKRGDTVVSTTSVKVSEIPETRGYVVLNFPLPLEPVRQGNYTLTLTAPHSAPESVIWYCRRNYEGNPTFVNGEKLARMEAAYEAFKTNLVYEYTDAIEPDAIFALAHAWYIYATAAPDTPADNKFIADSYPIMKKYVEVYIKEGYINNELKLMKTDYLEHTRDFRKWQAYDLITNVYASQVFYEFSHHEESLGNTEEAARWMELSELLKEGIYENLTAEVNGKKIYAEMIAIDEDNKFYPGMTWVNLAPIAAEWYAIDTEMMKRTFEVYAEEATVYCNGIPMLDACYNMFNGGYAEHIIGKGYSWELMFNAATGNTERVDQMIEFMLMYTPGNNMYPESWWYPDKFSDVGNQEHSCWIAYAMATVYPELKDAISEIRYDIDEDGAVTVADALTVLKRVAFANNYYLSEKEEVDLDGDGFATVSDALKVLRKAVGLI